MSITEAFSNGKLVLRLDEQGRPLQGSEGRLSVVEASGRIVFNDGHFFTVDSDGRILDGQGNRLGHYFEGAAFDTRYEQVANADGPLAAEACAAVLALRVKREEDLTVAAGSMPEGSPTAKAKFPVVGLVAAAVAVSGYLVWRDRPSWMSSMGDGFSSSSYSNSSSTAPPVDIYGGREHREVPPADGDSGYTVVKETIDGKPLWIPFRWEAQPFLHKSSGADVYRWSQGDAFVRVDVMPQVSDLMSIVRDEQARFQKSSRYEYQLRRLRSGSEAYLGGVIWNFRLKHDDGPMMKRAIAYVNKDGKTYAVSTGAPEGSSNTSRLFTEVLDSLHGWE